MALKAKSYRSARCRKDFWILCDFEPGREEFYIIKWEVRSAIPDNVLAKIKDNNLEPFSKSIFLQNHSIFDLDSSMKVKFDTAKVKDFYWLLNKKGNYCPHT